MKDETTDITLGMRRRESSDPDQTILGESGTSNGPEQEISGSPLPTASSERPTQPIADQDSSLRIDRAPREISPSNETMAWPRKSPPNASETTIPLVPSGDEPSIQVGSSASATDFTLADEGSYRGKIDQSDVTAAFDLSGSGPTDRTNVDIPASESSRPADFIPGYEILGELGRGGMGVVYKARQRQLNRVVALKMVLSGGHASQGELVRFLAEAEAVAQLHHPNIVQIHEIGQHNGLPFFTLEFMEGGSLTDRIKEHPLPALEAARIVEAMARAMQYAHERGIIHRDLKPDNVLLTADGTPKITDFGLAKKIEGGSGMTQTGAIMGTPSYMAPEQADGRTKNVGPSADIYSLGAVLYRLITGRPPFQAATPIETVLMVVRDEPVPPRQLLPRLPRDIETICLKCLQKDPNHRYATAGDLADDLARFINDEPVYARPIRPWERWIRWARRHPSTAALIVIGVLAVTGGAGFLAYSQYQRKREQAQLRDQTNEHIQRGKEAIAREDWKAAELQLDQAYQVLQSEPALLHQFPELESLRTTAKQRLRALAILSQFRQLRDEALLQSARASGNGSSAQQAVTIRRIKAALASVGVDDEASDPLVLPPGLTPQEERELSAGCYELLLAMAEAWAQPLLGQSPQSHREKVEWALRLMDRAANIGCAEHPTIAFALRRSRYQNALEQDHDPRVIKHSAATVKATSTLDHYLLGDEYYKQGQIDEAAAAFEAVLRSEPRHFWARYFLALCQLRQGRPELARAHLTACLAQNPDTSIKPWILLMRGYASGQLARASDRSSHLPLMQEAEADFQSALDALETSDPSTRAEAEYALFNNRGVMRVQMERVEEGLADLRRAIAIDPAQYPARVSLALALHERNETNQALRELTQALEVAGKLQASGELDASSLAGLFRQRSQLHLEQWQSHRCRAMISGLGLLLGPWGTVTSLLGFTSGDNTPCDRAREDLARAVAILETSAKPDRALQARMLLQLGRIHQSRDNHSEAVATFARVLSLTPDSTEAMRRRAMSLMKLGQVLEAERGITDYLQACQKQAIRPTVDAVLIRASTRERLGWFDEAIEDYSHALALEPNRNGVATQLRRGRLYLATNKYQFALSDFDAVLAAEPDSVDALLGRALARAKLGLYVGARQDVGHAESLGFRTPVQMVNAAKVLALLVTAAESRQLRWSADETFAEMERLLHWLDQALSLSVDRPEVLWRNWIRADASFQPVRWTQRFLAREIKACRELLRVADQTAGDRSRSVDENLDAARTFAQLAEFPPPEAVLGGRSREDLRTAAEQMIERALNQVAESQRSQYWMEVLEPDPYLLPLQSRASWSEWRRRWALRR